MANKLNIVNLALSHLPSKPLTSTTDSGIDTEETPQAEATVRIYEFALKETLAAYNWGFAKVKEALSDSTFSPLVYDYAYIHPGDNCVAIRRIFNASTADRTLSENYEIQYDSANDTQVIVTDIDDAYIEYTYYVVNEALYTAHFVTAFSYRLASGLAMPLTGDKEKAKELMNLFNNAISDAHRIEHSQRQNPHEANETSNFISSRA